MNYLPKIIANGLSKATYNYIALICCGMTCVLALMAITGWLLRIPVLAALSSENIPMAP
jgi:hypothetical protein